MEIPYSEKVTMQDAAQATGNGAPIIAANLGTAAMVKAEVAAQLQALNTQPAGVDATGDFQPA